MAKVREKTETSARNRNRDSAEGTRKCTELMDTRAQGRTTLQVNTSDIIMPNGGYAHD